MEMQPRAFTSSDHQTWRTILSSLEKTRDSQMCDLFLRGVETLGLRSDRFPALNDVNRILQAKTGFEGVFVEGLEEGRNFYQLLKERRFPIGNFIRSAQDLSYTPAPDIVHDLYGHLPFYTHAAYADFSQAIGAAAVEVADRPDLIQQYERFFWFTLEFGLIETSKGRRIFGAGIASSIAECDFALSEKVEAVPFSVDAVCDQEFRIDQIQKKLFILKSFEQLLESFELLQRRIRRLS